jgi:3-oxoacyl-[acyl-carrier-protein] synthase III
VSNDQTKRQVRDIRIVSTGSFTPTRVLTNADLEKMVDTSDEWIVTRSGIRERHICSPGQAASDLAEGAARRALERAGLSAGDLDGIIVATVTGDHWFPSTACILQARLGASKAFAFDVMAGCSGFLYALQVARGLIGSGVAETLLVVGVEILSKVTDWQDRTTCVLFGDASGAVIVRPGDESHRILGLRLGADGTNSDLITLPGGGTRIPISHEVIDRREIYCKMKGNEVFKMGVRGMEEVARQILEETGTSVEEVKLVIPHQANMRIIEALAKRLGAPMDRVYCNIHKYGNTSSASVPLALDEALAEGRIVPGDLVLMVVFGAGLTWGAGLMRW